VRMNSCAFWLVSGFLAPHHYFELNLTSDDAPIYHYLIWDETKLMLGHSFSPPVRKTNALSSTRCSSGEPLDADNSLRHPQSEAGEKEAVVFV